MDSEVLATKKNFTKKHTWMGRRDFGGHDAQLFRQCGRNDGVNCIRPKYWLIDELR